jgi:hypothetical protein
MTTPYDGILDIIEESHRTQYQHKEITMKKQVWLRPEQTSLLITGLDFWIKSIEEGMGSMAQRYATKYTRQQIESMRALLSHEAGEVK